MYPGDDQGNEESNEKLETEAVITETTKELQNTPNLHNKRPDTRGSEENESTP